jgi:hypothetical protein
MSNLKLVVLEMKCKKCGEKVIVSMPMHITDEDWNKTKEEMDALMKCND